MRIAEPCVEKPLPTHLKLYFPDNLLSAATDARGKIVANPLTAAISLSMSKGRYPSCGVCCAGFNAGVLSFLENHDE
ncbi:hypothetical protein ACCT30_41245, partial [Rhizobium ruizarguesonis]